MRVSTSSGQLRRYPTGWIQAHWSKPTVREDLNNYGWGSFEDFKILALGYSKDELNVLEAYFIKLKDSVINGYNSQLPPRVGYRYRTRS